MKKCPYCGKEYADDVERCLIDNEILLAERTETVWENEGIVKVEPAVNPIAEPKVNWTERDIRIFEVILVCAIAFSGGVLSSLNALRYDYVSANSGGTTFSWLYAIVRQSCALALLWYVLFRNKKSFAELGLKWKRDDFGLSILLRIAGYAAYMAIYQLIYLSGLTSANLHSTFVQVSHHLFGGGIFLTAILYQFLNPFFEELIVRAYLMTEIKALTGSATKAIIASTVLQTSYHFYQGVPAALAHGATFLLWSIYYSRTNRIAPIILAHLYADVGSSLWYWFKYY